MDLRHSVTYLTTPRPLDWLFTDQLATTRHLWKSLLSFPRTSSELRVP